MKNYLANKGKQIKKSNWSNSVNQNKCIIEDKKYQTLSMSNRKFDNYSTNTKTISRNMSVSHNSSTNLTPNIDNFIKKSKVQYKKEQFISQCLSQNNIEFNEEDAHNDNVNTFGNIVSEIKLNEVSNKKGIIEKLKEIQDRQGKIDEMTRNKQRVHNYIKKMENDKSMSRHEIDSIEKKNSRLKSTSYYMNKEFHSTTYELKKINFLINEKNSDDVEILINDEKNIIWNIEEDIKLINKDIKQIIVRNHLFKKEKELLMNANLIMKKHIEELRNKLGKQESKITEIISKARNLNPKRRSNSIK